MSELVEPDADGAEDAAGALIDLPAGGAPGG